MSGQLHSTEISDINDLISRWQDIVDLLVRRRMCSMFCLRIGNASLKQQPAYGGG